MTPRLPFSLPLRILISGIEGLSSPAPLTGILALSFAVVRCRLRRMLACRCWLLRGSTEPRNFGLAGFPGQFVTSGPRRMGTPDA